MRNAGCWPDVFGRSGVGFNPDGKFGSAVWATEMLAGCNDLRDESGSSTLDFGLWTLDSVP